MTEPLPVLRWVIDTNVLVSWVLRPHSVPARVVRRAGGLGRLLFSRATHGELLSVMRRSKFDAYVQLDRRLALLVKLDDLIDWVVPTRPIRACRDPKDDQILEVAVHGNADALITGDADLLALHPFLDLQLFSRAMIGPVSKARSPTRLAFCKSLARSTVHAKRWVAQAPRCERERRL